jgi:dienelactone hydrolase
MSSFRLNKIGTALLVVSVSCLGAPGVFAQETPANLAAQPSKTGANSHSQKKGVKGGNPYHEDFAILPVESSSLRTELAVLGELDDKPGLPYIRERWHLEWRPGDPIDVYILKPRGVEKPPVVLYLYSYPQDTERFKSDSWGGYVTGNGFAAVGFVSALTGHRLEHRPPKETFFTEFQESLGATVHDVQMILNYLSTRKDLDMSRVGMFGQGSGGAIAILASSVDARIKALDVLMPWGDWPTFLDKSTFVPSEDRLKVNTPEYLAKIAQLDPLQCVSKVKARSLRIQDVRKDNHIPDAVQEHLEAAAPNIAEINQYGDHAALVPSAGNGRLLNWMQSQLQPDANAQVMLDKSKQIHFFPAKMPTGSPIGEIH